MSVEKDIVENEKQEDVNDNASENQTQSQSDQPSDDTGPGSENDISILKKQLEEQQEKHLRLYADFENYKKRNAKEKLEFLKMAGQEIIRDLLPVLDDFQRAEKAYAADKNAENYVNGVKLIFEKLQKTLLNKGLKPIESIGTDFNIEYHEAIAEVPAPSEKLKGKIVDEVESGYMLNDTIIRYAKVVVGK